MTPSPTGKRLFDGGLRKVPLLALLVCLTIFLGYSFHSHSDGDDHSDDCSICAAFINSHAIPAVVTVLIFCFFVIIVSFRFVPPLPESAETHRQGSRAPPLFV